MTALNFPASPSSGDVHNAANGLQYAFDGVKWTSQGTYDSGTINAQKLDSIASQFNGSTTTFNLKVNNNTVKPHNEQSVSIVLAGHLQEPGTAYTTSQTGTITFATAPTNGTAFFGVLLTRLPVTSSSSSSGSGSVSPASANAAGTMSASDFTKLAGIDVGAKDDQTGAEIKAAYEGEADTNAFTDADHTKLDGIATGAEVNVQSNWNQTDNTADDFIQNKPSIPAAYGNSDVDSHLNTSTASNGQILSWTGTDYDWVDDATGGGGGGGGLSNVVEDTTPQLGGNLDVQDKKLTTSTTNNNIQLEPNGTGVVEIRGAGGNDGTLQLNCSAQSHGVKIKSPPHSAGASYTLTLPTTDGSNGEFLKTDGSGVLSWGSSSTSVTASDINAAFGDTAQLILGNGSADNSSEGNSDNDDALVLYYGTGSGTNYGVISADNGVHIQYDGANKLEVGSSGVKWIGDLFCDDNQILKLGSSADLQIYHNSTNNNSYITESGSGSLYIQGVNVVLENTAGANYFAGVSGAEAILYHNGNSKFQTTSSGVSVTGNITVTGTVDGVDIAALNTTVSGISSPTATSINALYPDNGNLILGTGTGDDTLKLYYDGTNAKITSDNAIHLQQDGANRLEISTTGTKWIGDLFCDDGQYIKVGTSADLRIYHASNNSYIDDQGAGGLLVKTSLFDVRDQNFGNSIFYGDPTGSGYLYYAGSYKFKTMTYGAFLNGDLQMNDNSYLKLGTDSDLRITHDGSNGYIENDTGNLIIKDNNSACIVKIIGYENTRAELQLHADDGDDPSDKWHLRADQQDYFQIAHLETDGNSWDAAFYAVPNGRSELLYDGVKKLETGTTYVRVTGDLSLNDGYKVLLGNSNDLQLFHDGTHSRISDQGTGWLVLETSRLQVNNPASNKEMIVAIEDSRVELFYDSSKKFETVSGGVKAYGHIYADDNNEIRLGNSGDLQIYHDGTDSRIHNSTGRIVTRTATEAGWYNSNGTEPLAIFKVNGEAQLFYDNALKLETQTSGVKWFGDLYCDDNQTIKLGSSADLRLYHDGSNSYINDQGTGALRMMTNLLDVRDANFNNSIFYGQAASSSYFYYDGSYKIVTESIGVSINGVLRPAATNSHDLGASDRRWATIYAVNNLNTSDENEKKDINNCDLGLDFVNKINPVSYKWKDEQLGSKTHYGLLAQNIEDAVKSEGKTLDDFGAIHKPQHTAMGLNYNQIIAPLVKAIQELSAKVAALEAA